MRRDLFDDAAGTTSEPLGPGAVGAGSRSRRLPSPHYAVVASAARHMVAQAASACRR
jgi:hypothetical protein